MSNQTPNKTKQAREKAGLTKTQGGKRSNAGRKPKPDKRQPITIKLPPDIIERLRNAELSQSVMIETALREKYGWNL